MNVRPSFFKQVRDLFCSCRDDEQGFALVLGAIFIPALLLAFGLVIDIGFAMQERSKAQAAADFAAIAGSELLGTQGYTFTDAQNAAYAIAAKNGYPSSSATVTANYPWAMNPKVGAYRNSNVSNDPYMFEVRISKTRRNIFGSLLNLANTTIGVRALADYTGSLPCIVILNTGTGVASGVNMNGVNAKLLTPCGLYINSADTSRALNANTGANSVCNYDPSNPPDPLPPPSIISMVGGSTGQYTTGVCSNETLVPNSAPVANPYANTFTSIPSGTPAGTQNYNSSTKTYTFTPGRFNNGITISGPNGSTATFASGTYYVDDNGVSFQQVDVNAAPAGGVTFVLTDADDGKFTMKNANVTITAPPSTSSLPFPNFAILQRNASSMSGNGVDGGILSGGTNSSLTVNGLVVLPYANFKLSGGAGVPATCSGFVVWTLEISGNSTVVDGCKVTNTNTTGLKSARLIE